MTTTQMGLSRLNAYDFGFLQDKFSQENPELTPLFGEAASELRRFFELVLIGKGPLAVLSKKVDALWHTFVIHTPQYRKFCNEVNGEYIDHQPHSDMTPVPGVAITNFYQEYASRFGNVPKIWTEDIPPAHVIAISQGQLPPEMLQRRWSGWTGRS